MSHEDLPYGFVYLSDDVVVEGVPEAVLDLSLVTLDAKKIAGFAEPVHAVCGDYQIPRAGTEKEVIITKIRGQLIKIHAGPSGKHTHLVRLPLACGLDPRLDFPCLVVDVLVSIESSQFWIVMSLLQSGDLTRTEAGIPQDEEIARPHEAAPVADKLGIIGREHEAEFIP